MRTFLLAVSLVVITLMPAQAHLGETLEQCIARYGAPTGTTTDNDGNKTADFLKDGVIVGITFLNGKAAYELYMKADASELSATELKTLLEADSDAKNTWSEYKNTDQLKSWNRTDNAFAAYAIPIHYLTVETKEYIDLPKAK